MTKDITLATALLNRLDGEPGYYCLAVKDLSTDHRWAINNEPMRSASLIKIFIMIEALRQADRGNLDLNSPQTVTADIIVGGAGSLQEAKPGTIITWNELIKLMIVESDNTATNILINQLSMPAINETITRLGCHDTVLRRKMMDFTAAANGQENITSATDMINVLDKLYHYRCLGPVQDEIMLSILKQQEDKCKLPVLLPSDVIIAHKTGELDGAEHDAGIIYGKKTHYIAAIMADKLPDPVVGRALIAELSLMIYNFLNT